MRNIFYKLFMTLALNFLIIGASYGQVAILLLIFGDKLASEDLHLSIDGALNASNISKMGNGSTLYGLNFGLGLHMNLNERWQFNPQFKPLSQKGIKNTNPLIDLPSELVLTHTDLKLSYIEFPVMMRYNVTPDFFIAVGPQLSLLSSASQKSIGKYTNDLEAELKLDAKEFFNKVSFSFPIELGYWIYFSNKKSSSEIKLNLFARYCHEFSRAFNDKQSFGNARISTFQFGVSFPTIKKIKN
ncbi:MAG: PorT family protein [Bacteroidetes bacterium]|nr:PorT family protein [Bacteroidota bacterium]